jgi:hypothetical protein
MTVVGADIRRSAIANHPKIGDEYRGRIAVLAVKILDFKAFLIFVPQQQISFCSLFEERCRLRTAPR